jgi:hypothetical protein
VSSHSSLQGVRAFGNDTPARCAAWPFGKVGYTLKTEEKPHEDDTVDGEAAPAKTSPEFADELRFAPLANLMGRAISSSAASLVSRLADAYPRTTKTAKRSNKPRKLEPQLHAAIGAFLADLLMAQGNQDSGGWLRLSLAKNDFKKPSPVSYRMFGGLRTAWKAAGLIEERAGYSGKRGFGNPGPIVGSMTRFRATPKLLKVSKERGVLIHDVQDHFFIEFEMPSELVQLTSPSGLTRNTAEAKGLRNEVAELNAHFATHKLEGARHIGWVRKFHGASPDKYMLNRGGRLYSQPPMPATNYQNMPQERRLKLRMDGEPVSEIDISASYLTIFYAAHGKRIEMSDAYRNIVGPDALDRAIVKFWVNASFGNSSLITKWSPKLKKAFAQRYREDGWTIDGKKYPVRSVREKTLSFHPLLGQWGTKLAPNMPWSWGHLMFSESRVIISTMLRLAREHNIPAAPVHDSLIVPRSKEVIAYRILDEQFTKIIGVIPKLKLSPVNAAFF